MLLELSMLIGMIALSGLITSGYPTPVSGRLGSDLLLPVEDACRTNGSYPFDIYSKNARIGTYHDGFQGLRGYNGRLTYDLKTCTVKLSNLTEEDGTKFYVKFLHGIDGKSGQHNISYIIIMNNGDSRTTDPPHVTASEPTSYKESQVPPRRHHSSVSFYFSLDSVVNAIISFVVLILKKSCEMLEENRANFACQIIRCFAVLFQVISIGLISNGSPYSWFLILIPTILSVDVLLYFGCLPGCVGAHITVFMDKCFCACCNDDKNSIWSGFILLLQVVFPVCVGIIWYKTDDDNSRGESSNIGYGFLAVLISLVLNTGVFFITYCCKTKWNGFTQVPSKETGTAPDNHEDTCKAPVYNVHAEDKSDPVDPNCTLLTIVKPGGNGCHLC